MTDHVKSLLDLVKFQGPKIVSTAVTNISQMTDMLKFHEQIENDLIGDIRVLVDADPEDPEYEPAMRRWIEYFEEKKK